MDSSTRVPLTTPTIGLDIYSSGCLICLCVLPPTYIIRRPSNSHPSRLHVHTPMMRLLGPLSRTLLPRATTSATTTTPWICKRCISSTIPRRFPSTVLQTSSRTKSRRRAILLAVVGTGVVGASAVGWMDGKHYLNATERALRVAKTLFLNIQE